MDDMSPRTTLVSMAGGKINVIGDGGEVLLAVPVLPGQSPWANYSHLIPSEYEVEFIDVVLVPPASGVGIQPYGDGSHESGANPDYTPSSADIMQRQLRLQMDRLIANNDALERRVAGLAAIERIPRAPDPVIEKITPEPVADAPSAE